MVVQHCAVCGDEGQKTVADAAVIEGPGYTANWGEIPVVRA